MATTVSLRQLVDLPRWEMVTSPGNNYSWAHVARSTLWDQFQLWTGDYVGLYNPLTDAWLGIIANPAGSTIGAYHPWGPSGTATAGGASTITTNLTLPGSLAKYSIRTTGGTGAGQERVILTNTFGANAVITVTSPWTVAPDNTTTYQLITGRFWTWGASVRYYDVATNTWSAALSITGTATVTALTATPSYGNPQATGTATSATSTTLVNSGKAWPTNQYRNSQVRITGGTGIGQVRVITASDATSLTVATWTVTPDATSTYTIEPDDNALYAANGVTNYKYSISGNSWTTLSPATARTSAITINSYHFIGTAYDTTWADETNMKNGRFIYSFGASMNLAVYDIALNTWNNPQLVFGRGGSAFGASSVAQDRELLYLIQQPATTAYPNTNWRFNCATQNLDAWGSWNIPTGGGAGQHASLSQYTDGGTTITWVYMAYGSYYDFRFFRILVV
jgi:hypothetical protein